MSDGRPRASARRSTRRPRRTCRRGRRKPGSRDARDVPRAREVRALDLRAAVRLHRRAVRRESLVARFVDGVRRTAGARIAAARGSTPAFLARRGSALLWITVAMVGARSFAFVRQPRGRHGDRRAQPAHRRARDPRGTRQGVGAVAVLGRRARRVPVRGVAAAADHAAAVADRARRVPRLSVPQALHVAVPLLAGHLPRPRARRRVGRGHGRPVASRRRGCSASRCTLWTAGFDIIYALQDIECDVRDGLHSRARRPRRARARST